MHTELFQIVNIPGVLENTGIYQFILPFLLSLAITYGILSYALGNKIQKSAIGLISLVLSFFVMLYSSWNLMIVNFFANLSGSALLVATGILVIVIFLGLFGVKPENIVGGEKGITKAGWIFIFTLVFIGILLFLGTGWWSLIPTAYLSPDFQAAILIIIIIALAMWWMTEEKTGE